MAKHSPRARDVNHSNVLQREHRAVEEGTGSAVTRDFYCHRCSCKVTEYAHADGRAEELADVALYLCRTCAAEAQRKGTETVGEYRILQRLGRGGISVVYKAWHAPTCRLVALKKVVPESSSREGAEEVFQKEVKVMQTLIHPHIVRLIDYRMVEKPYYLVYEYLPNGDLYTYVQKHTVSVTDICRIFCQVLEGLEYMHRKGIVHRDVKPHNILLTLDKKAKLGDFSCVKNLHEDGILKGDHGGLPFLTPEEILNHDYVKSSTDVYAVGVSLYYILTDTFPFHFASPEEIIKAFLIKKKPKDPIDMVLQHKKELESELRRVIGNSILREDRILIQSYRKDIPATLAAIIDKSVAKNEENRFKSAQEMREALVLYLTDECASMKRS